jgi:hypothetical protein
MAEQGPDDGQFAFYVTSGYGLKTHEPFVSVRGKLGLTMEQAGHFLGDFRTWREERRADEEAGT